MVLNLLMLRDVPNSRGLVSRYLRRNTCRNSKVFTRKHQMPAPAPAPILKSSKNTKAALHNHPIPVDQPDTLDWGGPAVKSSAHPSGQIRVRLRRVTQLPVSVPIEN